MDARRLASALAAVALTVSLPAAAQVYDFLRYPPTHCFTEADWQRLRETLEPALDSSPDGERLAW